MLKIKILLDSTYITSYCLISLLFTAKYFEWYLLAISSFPPLFLLESIPIRNPHHCIQIDLGKFTSGFCIAKSNQCLVFILFGLSVSFDIIFFLLLKGCSLVCLQDTNTYLAFFSLCLDTIYVSVFLVCLHLPGL